MTLLAHEVPAGKITWLAASQQLPAVQQPGLSTVAHRPTLVLHCPSLHGTPPPSQSLLVLQQPGCWVPLQVPAAVQTSLKVQGLLSVQNVPGLDDHASGLLYA